MRVQLIADLVTWAVVPGPVAAPRWPLPGGRSQVAAPRWPLPGGRWPVARCRWPFAQVSDPRPGGRDPRAVARALVAG